MIIKNQKNLNKRKKNRCFSCNKKIAIAGQFECKCGYVFCSLHRYPDAHNCNFDYQKAQQEKLQKNNIVVAPEKVTKI